jgi:hypothetical protein
MKVNPGVLASVRSAYFKSEIIGIYRELDLQVVIIQHEGQ